MPETESQVDWGTCKFLGHDHPAERRWNGQPICWAAWHAIKLDVPAARHWAKAVVDFRAGVDMYDIMTFWPKRCGLTKEEIKSLSDILAKIQKGAQEVLSR